MHKRRRYSFGVRPESQLKGYGPAIPGFMSSILIPWQPLKHSTDPTRSAEYFLLDHERRKIERRSHRRVLDPA